MITHRFTHRTARRLVIPTVAAVAVGVVLSGSIAAAGPNPPWSPVNSPSPATGADATNVLTSVSCHGSVCVAVGVGSTTHHTSDIVLRRQGSTWKVSPVLAHQAQGLTAVSCPTSTWCMAVGVRGFGPHGFAVPAAQTLTASKATNASAGLTTKEQNNPVLTAVSCRSEKFCIAVGSQVGENSLHSSPIVIRWNGTKWTSMSVPNPGITATYNGVAPIGSSLAAIRCTSTKNCVAVGATLTPVSPNDGTEQRSNYFTYAVHYNGKKWKRTATPNAASTPTASINFNGDRLESLACPSATDCYATGNLKVKGALKGFIEHWNGTKWTKAFSELPSNIALGPIACSSTTSCYTPVVPDSGASGLYQNFLHGSKKSWSATGTAIATVDTVNGVTCPSTTSCVAVGTAPGTGTGSKTLVADK